MNEQNAYINMKCIVEQADGWNSGHTDETKDRDLKIISRNK